MVVALSRFTIANDMAGEVRQAFPHRPHLVDSAPGFLGREPVPGSASVRILDLFAE